MSTQFDPRPQTLDELRADLGIGTGLIRPTRWCWCRNVVEPIDGPAGPHQHDPRRDRYACPERRVAWTVRREEYSGGPVWMVRHPDGDPYVWWPVAEHERNAAEFARKARFEAHRWATGR